MTLDDLARKVTEGIKRKQIVVGKERFENMARRKEIGLVWFTCDLSKSAFHNMWKTCKKRDIKVIYAGYSDEVGEITGLENCKVYVFKKSFSGLKEFISDIPEEFIAWED